MIFLLPLGLVEFAGFHKDNLGRASVGNYAGCPGLSSAICGHMASSVCSDINFFYGNNIGL